MKTVDATEKKSGLALLREPFPANQISYLPKGGVKLAYVGHAALTDRLLDADPLWNWEFVAVAPDGSPVIDAAGGMWIRLTVCGITRLGYGDAGEKKGANAMKERIGDALRNAAMRFGAALDLWHKGELHADEPEPEPAPKPLSEPEVTDFVSSIESASSLAELRGAYTEAFKSAGKDESAVAKFTRAKDSRKSQLEQPQAKAA